MKPINLRDRAMRLLKELGKEYPTCDVIKASKNDRVYVILPQKEVMVPVPTIDKELDLKLLEKTVELAQRLASSLVRETLDSLADQVASKLIGQLPTQQVIIKQTVDQVVRETKDKFTFSESNSTPIMKANMELVGSTGESKESKTDISGIIDQLSKLDLVTKK